MSREPASESPPPEAAPRSLRKTIAAEENNFEVSVARLGETVTLIDDFADAFGRLGDLLRETENPDAHLFSISILHLSSSYQFEKACLECLRGRLTDAIQITRRSIEAAAFAARIARHPHLSEVWFSASPDDDSYDDYRKKFTPGKLFPEEDELLARLGRRWDSASRQTHTSASSIARRANISRTEHTLEFDFSQFEVDDDDPSEPARALLWILDTHLGVLQVFRRVFSEQLGPLATGFDVRMNALDGKLAAFKEQWRDTILPRGDDNQGES